MQTANINRGLPPILLFVLVAAFFLGGITNGFTWHDRPLMQEASAMSLGDVPGLLLETQSSPDFEGGVQYRPEARILFFLEQKLLGERPVWRHVLSVLLHYLTVLLFYKIVLMAFSDIRLAMFSSILFALHPVAVEPVNSLMAREGIICGLFLMVSLWALFRARKEGFRWGVLSVCAFALSVLSLELGMMFALFIATMGFFSGNGSLRVRVSPVVVFILVTAAYFAFRGLLHGSEALFAEEALWPGSLNSSGLLASVYAYLSVIAFPFYLHVGYSPLPVEILSFPGIVTISVIAVLSIIVILPRTPLVLRASCIWIVVFSIPFLVSVPYLNFPLSDRYAYLALPGACLLFGWSLNALNLRNYYFSWLLLFVIVIALGTATYRQNIVWTNDFTLWENAVERSPYNAYVNYNMGRIHDEVDAREKAIVYYETALVADPLYVAPHIGLGNMYARADKYQLAVEHYTAALMLAPDRTHLYLSLGDVFMKMGELDRAISVFSRCLKLAPDNPEAHHRMAVALGEREDYVNSLEHFRESLSLGPRFAKTHYDFSRMLLKLNDRDNALYELRLALLIKPDYTEARRLLSEIEGSVMESASSQSACQSNTPTN